MPISHSTIGGGIIRYQGLIVAGIAPALQKKDMQQDNLCSNQIAVCISVHTTNVTSHCSVASLLLGESHISYYAVTHLSLNVVMRSIIQHHKKWQGQLGLMKTQILWASSLHNHSGSFALGANQQKPVAVSVPDELDGNVMHTLKGAHMIYVQSDSLVGKGGLK